MAMLSKLILLLRVSVAGLLLFACVFQPGPDAAAKEWVQALAAQDGLIVSDLSCNANQNALATAGALNVAFGAVLGALLGGAQPKLGVEELTFATTRNDGKAAEVQVSGKVRVAIGIASTTRDLNVTMPMVYENGKWKYCQVIKLGKSSGYRPADANEDHPYP